MAIKKKIKLLIFGIIFVVITPVIVLYANGNIFTDGWSLLKTGGIYVRSAPIGSEVYLNNKYKDKISFFQRDLLIKNLKQGNYEIKVKKQGYNTWSKKLKVVNNLVTDADVFTLPEKVETKSIPRLILSNPDISTSTKIKNPEYYDILSLFTSTSTKIYKTSSTTATDFKSNLGTKRSPIMNNKLGLWKEDNKIYVEWFGRNESAPKYLCDESAECTKPMFVFELAKTPTKIDFLPGYEGVIVVATEDLVFAVQIEDNPSKMIQILYRGKSPSFRFKDNNLYVKDKDILAEVLL